MKPSTPALSSDVSKASEIPIHRGFLDRLHRIDLAGLGQAYRRTQAGQRGAPLVLLHGLMDNSAGFAPLLAALDAVNGLTRDVIAPDWRGHGHSDATPGAYWFPNYLADLEALLAALDVAEPVVLVGHSMGGQIASLYAGARPSRVAGLVTLDSLNVPDTDPSDTPNRYRDWLDTILDGASEADRLYVSRDDFAARLARRYPELSDSALRYLAEAWLRPAENGHWRLRLDPAHRRRMPYGFRAAEAAALWREVRCPVLCVDGARSPAAALVDDRTQAARRACFADVQHVVLADCGHMLHVQDAPAVADQLLAFLRRIDTRA